MKKIGITGGIGTGKSSVVAVFEALGIPAYNSDTRAKWLMTHDPELRRAIVTLFGPLAYLATGELDRARLATEIFSNITKREQLNAAVHPRVRLDFERWANEQCQLGTPYVLQEAAILIESGAHLTLDAVICVTAPRELQIERIIRRDSTSTARAEARIDAQMPPEARLAHARYIIRADDTELLVPQVLKIHADILL